MAGIILTCLSFLHSEIPATACSFCLSSTSAKRLESSELSEASEVRKSVAPDKCADVGADASLLKLS